MLVVDTGVIFEVADGRDDDHDVCGELLDASVVAIAQRLRVATLATLNHRDFQLVRPSHIDAFELLPTI